MTENTETCRHWSKDNIEGENNRSYCKDCNMIFLVHPSIYGTITIGKLSSNFEQRLNNNVVDMVGIITETLGVKNVNVASVYVAYNADRYWNQILRIGFSAGNALMLADIDYTKTNQYEATGTYYTPTPFVS